MNKSAFDDPVEIIRSEQFDHFATPEEHLKTLRVFAVSEAGSDARKSAKERLVDASVRLIFSRVRATLKECEAVSGIGLNGQGTVCKSVFATVLRDFSKLADGAAEQGKSLFTILSMRARDRVLDRLAKAGAQKRNAPPASGIDCETLPDLADGSNLSVEDAVNFALVDELRRAIDAMEQDDSTAAAILLAVHFSEESATAGLPVANVARAMGIPVTTAQSAYQRGLAKLKEPYEKSDNSD